jgi:hypothetical protein
MSDALDPERLGTKRTPALIELTDGSEARSPMTSCGHALTQPWAVPVGATAR